MDYESTFRTKTGFCHILPDKIVLSRDGLIGNLAKHTVGSTFNGILLIHAGLSLALFYWAFVHAKDGQIFQAVLFGLLGIYFVYGIVNSIHNSATPQIERDKIREIKFKKGVAGITRSRFEILFENEKGQVKKRLILLPGSLTGGKAETEKALKMMKDEHLLL